jgi:hypothetical protein
MSNRQSLWKCDWGFNQQWNYFDELFEGLKTVEIIDKIYNVCKSFELMEPILFESGIKNVTFGENVKLFNQ